METTTTNSRAALTFRNPENMAVNISVPRARHDITVQEATAGMNAIIASGAVMTRTGRPHAIYAARIISTVRTRLI